MFKADEAGSGRTFLCIVNFEKKSPLGVVTSDSDIQVRRRQNSSMKGLWRGNMAMARQNIFNFQPVAFSLA